MILCIFHTNILCDVLKYFGHEGSYIVNMFNYFVDMITQTYDFDQKTDLKTSSLYRNYNRDKESG